MTNPPVLETQTPGQSDKHITKNADALILVGKLIYQMVNLCGDLLTRSKCENIPAAFVKLCALKMT